MNARIALACFLLACTGNGLAQVDVMVRSELPTSHGPDEMIICPFGAKKQVDAVRYGDIYPRGAEENVAFPAAFVPARLLHPPQVSYPLDLWAKGAEGYVSMAVRVDEQGRASDPKIVCSSDPGFEHAALDALGTLEYAPATLAGEAVPGIGVQPFNFLLN
jgi:TonB family protein